MNQFFGVKEREAALLVRKELKLIFEIVQAVDDHCMELGQDFGRYYGMLKGLVSDFNSKYGKVKAEVIERNYRYYLKITAITAEGELSINASEALFRETSAEMDMLCRLACIECDAGVDITSREHSFPIDLRSIDSYKFGEKYMRWGEHYKGE
jgi:hypothetical protein